MGPKNAGEVSDRKRSPVESVRARLTPTFGAASPRGYALDAENWTAHTGAASTILNIFRHPKTPQHFVVLSGDVHCSFVYDVELRGRIRGLDIWQISKSGTRSAFPARLLAVRDRGNRCLYSPRSPLNWSTRWRHMRVIPRKPQGTRHGGDCSTAAVSGWSS